MQYSKRRANDHPPVTTVRASGRLPGSIFRLLHRKHGHCVNPGFQVTGIQISPAQYHQENAKLRSWAIILVGRPER